MARTTLTGDQIAARLMKQRAPRPDAYVRAPRVRMVPITGDRVVPERFTFQREVPGVGVVELEIVTSDGGSLVERATITARPGTGVSGVRFDRVPILLLHEDALAGAAQFMAGGAGDAIAGSRRAAQGMIRRGRPPATPELLAEVMAAYESGGIREVMERLGVEERQARRRVAAARKAAARDEAQP